MLIAIFLHSIPLATFIGGELSVKLGHTKLAFKSSLSVFSERVHPFHSLSLLQRGAECLSRDVL
jgi:hypothetical protein